MIFNKQKHLLAKRAEANAFRFLKTTDNLVDFCSNDYLGLARKGEVFPEVQVKGSGGSRLLAGNYQEIEDLEGYLSNFHQAESALVFNSGYNANVGFFSAVPQKRDTVLYDELIHASIKDGMRLSFAKSFSFKHNSLDELEQRLKKAEGDVYVVVEAIYSMDGDHADLVGFVELCNRYKACLIVDEAHSVGVFGEKGEGLVQAFNLADQIPVRIITFGKAIGAHGAAVLCCSTLKDFLVNFSRSFIYTTALPPYCIRSIKNSYSSIEDGKATQILQSKIALFRNEISKYDTLSLIESESSIQCVLCVGNEKVKRVCESVSKAGFDIRPVMSPTVPIGRERIRICLHVFNSDEEIVGLVKHLAHEFLK